MRQSESPGDRAPKGSASHLRKPSAFAIRPDGLRSGTTRAREHEHNLEVLPPVHPGSAWSTLPGDVGETPAGNGDRQALRPARLRRVGVRKLRKRVRSWNESSR